VGVAVGATVTTLDAAMASVVAFKSSVIDASEPP